MSMDKNEALSLLTGNSSEDRIRAARFLTRHGILADIPLVEEALRAESNKWAKSALRRAIGSIRKDPTPSKITVGPEDEDERGIEQITAEAIEDTTQRLVHELRPVLGRLDLYASREIANYDGSRTKIEATRLKELLIAIDKLGQAAATPSYAEFNFVELVETVIQSEAQGSNITVEMSGPKPFLILGDSSMIHIILSNAIRNALESTQEAKSAESAVVSWGDTDRDNWFAVLDRGVGFPKGFANAFEIGTTTKKNHSGMGLASARRAALSLNGEISLGPREPNGAKFEFHWPRATQ
jgi:signal transduction histidine kinase